MKKKTVSDYSSLGVFLHRDRHSVRSPNKDCFGSLVINSCGYILVFESFIDFLLVQTNYTARMRTPSLLFQEFWEILAVKRVTEYSSVPFLVLDCQKAFDFEKNISAARECKLGKKWQNNTFQKSAYRKKILDSKKFEISGKL